MKKNILSSFVIVSFILYSINQRASGESLPNPPSLPSPTGQISGSPSSQTYKDGVYTGDSIDAFYGNVQVKAIISNGKITDVQFLDYPQDRQRSLAINSQAMPMLKSEAIQVQNANVDIISGATATSQAFIQSLQSALSKA